jgi:guanosine-3',5'-bis(diphosphate) 3'-pyrophosphohydrolase
MGRSFDSYEELEQFLRRWNNFAEDVGPYDCVGAAHLLIALLENLAENLGRPLSLGVEDWELWDCFDSQQLKMFRDFSTSILRHPQESSSDISPLPGILDALDFASHHHRDQRRKGAGHEPYVNHLIEVAALLAKIAGVKDTNVLVAAVLHDALEDTDATRSDLEARFGRDVVELVEAVTDDKSLPLAERQRLQVEHMDSAATEVRLLKLADHCSNVASIPPAWPIDRKRDYVNWSEKVAQACHGCNPALEEVYQQRLAETRRRIEDDT